MSRRCPLRYSMPMRSAATSVFGISSRVLQSFSSVNLRVSPSDSRRRRPVPVGGDEEVRARDRLAARERERSVGRRGDRGRVGADLDARLARHADERVVERLARGDVQALALGEGAVHENALAFVLDLPVTDRVRVGDRLLERADLLEHAQAVLPQPDPGAVHAQLAAALVEPDGPAPVGERRRRGEASQASSHDLSVTTRRHYHPLSGETVHSLGGLSSGPRRAVSDHRLSGRGTHRRP